MKIFTVYNSATGEIIRIGFVFFDPDVFAQPGPGESVLIGFQGDASTQKVAAPGGVPTLVNK